MDADRPKANGFKVAVIIWAGLTLSQLFYMIFGLVAAEPPDTPTAPTLVIVLSGMALFNLALSVGIRQWLTQPNQLQAQEQPAEAYIERAFPLPLTGLIITWAVAESCALFGLLLTLFSGEVQYVVGLGALTIVTMLTVHRPRRLRLDEFRLSPANRPEVD